eukprot:4539-Amphidinium_carterae.1
MEGQCDGPKEHDPYGKPDSYDIPTQTVVDWCRWAHAKSVNLGCSVEQSRSHLVSNLADDEERVQGAPLTGNW